MNKQNEKIGLSLSGGGYRAAAFHLGTLRKLHDLNLLGKIDVISTVSGGSIIGSFYSLSIADATSFDEFDKIFSNKLSKSVIRSAIFSPTFIIFAIITIIWITTILVTLFTGYAWVGLLLLITVLTLIAFFQFKIFPISKIVQKIYRNIFYSDKKLSDLPISPMLVINATNLETGRLFTFAKDKMEDSTYLEPQYIKPIMFNAAQFPIAEAVMASSCVPFAFSPISIEEKYFQDINQSNLIKPVLIDGGIYDNQGIHKLTHQNRGKNNPYLCQIVIVSDAGNKLPFESIYNNVITLLIRTSDLFMNRIKNFQMMQNLYNNVYLNKIEISYLSLGWDLDNCIPGFVTNLKAGNILQSVIQGHDIPSNFMEPFDGPRIQTYLENKIDFPSIKKIGVSTDQLKLARGVSTNLTSLSKSEIEALSNHAAALTELQIKLYCPSLFF